MKRQHKTTYLMILLSILLGYVFWVIDSLYVYSIYQKCAVDAIINDIPEHSFFARLVVIILSLITALLISYYYSVTEKVKHSLFRTLEVYQATLSTITDGLFDYDAESGKIYLSDSFYRLLGYEPGEFPQNRSEFESRIHPEDRLFAAAKLSEAYRNGLSFELEFRFKRQDGTFAWLRGSGKTACRDSEGRPARIVGIYKDISVLKDKEIEFYDNR